MKKIVVTVALLAAVLAQPSVQAAPETFEKAKIELRQKVYFDRRQADPGDLYCGCDWQWMGRSGGRVDLASCGYEVRADQNRAQRVEWEHIVPAWVLGHQRQCWQNGGRENCGNTDPVYRAMEADMHNLAPTIGEVNADRSNFRYGVLPSLPNQYGQCSTKTDFKQRVTEPRDEVKGFVARTQFYMHDRYGLAMSKQQQQLFMAWDRMYPVSNWERERDRRVAASMGHHNPFITGERHWTLGANASASDEQAEHGAPAVVGLPSRENAKERPQEAAGKGGEGKVEGAVIGNSSSKVYHLPVGCPSYGQVSGRNRVEFESAAEAEAAGYRRAGNCR